MPNDPESTLSAPILLSQDDDNNSADTQIYLNILFKFIKEFNGDRTKLVPYLNNVDSAFAIAHPSQKPILLAYVKSQLTGKAETACSNHVFNSWEELKGFLKDMYGDKKHPGHLLIELQNCKQLSNESISQYVFRLETALKNVLTVTQQGNHPENELSGRLAALNDLALHTFIINTKPEISQMLRSRNINSLNEAINIALEEEKVRLLLRQQEVGNKFCKNCKTPGHYTIHCRKSKQENPTSKGIGKNSYNVQTNSSNNKFCKYCKKIGHDITECRKRQRKNQLNQNSASGTSQNINTSNYNNKKGARHISTQSSNNSVGGNSQALQATAASPRELDQIAALTLN